MQRKPSILFVDDEIRIVRVISITFRESYRVFTAISGVEALEVLERERIDIIVSDQRMPGMTGIALLACVRERWPRTMRLLLTGYADLVAIIGAVNEGEVYRFIHKPWSSEELRATIAECARIATAMDDGTAQLLKMAASPPLASATKLLALDGVPSDRLEICELFTQDYHVLSASSQGEARRLLAANDVGVIVGDCGVEGEDTLDFLRELKRSNPFLAVVVLSSSADSDTIVKLINQAHIYRFAMKPINANVFRLAVAAAMREHHRLLIEPGQGALRKRLVGEDPEMTANLVRQR